MYNCMYIIADTFLLVLLTFTQHIIFKVVHTLWAKFVTSPILMKVGRNTLQHGMRYRYQCFILQNNENGDVTAPPSEHAENP